MLVQRWLYCRSAILMLCLSGNWRLDRRGWEAWCCWRWCGRGCAAEGPWCEGLWSQELGWYLIWNVIGSFVDRIWFWTRLEVRDAPEIGGSLGWGVDELLNWMLTHIWATSHSGMKSQRRLLLWPGWWQFRRSVTSGGSGARQLELCCVTV